jgi:hypothetical protein
MRPESIILFAERVILWASLPPLPLPLPDGSGVCLHSFCVELAQQALRRVVASSYTPLALVRLVVVIVIVICKARRALERVHIVRWWGCPAQSLGNIRGLGSRDSLPVLMALPVRACSGDHCTFL